jgi:hypothetical protein
MVYCQLKSACPLVLFFSLVSLVINLGIKPFSN